MKIKKNLKGASKGGCIVAILVIALLVVAAIFLLKNFGLFGFGSGEGDGDGEKDSVSETSSVQEVEPAVVEYTEVEVVIKGKDYVYNGGTYDDLDALITELNKLAEEKGNIVNVNITEENGLADALDALKGRLASEEKLKANDMTTADS